MIKVNIKVKRDKFDVAIHETFSNGITGIFGHSGSGKTTLLNSICGLVHPDKGEIIIQGKKVYCSKEKINVPVQKRNIGYVFQEGRLFPHMTVEKNLYYGLKKNGANQLGFDEVVEMLNLKHLLQSKPKNISGGERQRTALGRSLLSSPELLLLDEPFSAVDTKLRSQIIPFLLKIHKTTNIPLLVVSHDLPDLLKLSNKLCIVSDGKCIGHNDYYKLLKDKSINGILSNNSFVNSIDMKVSKVKPEEGLTVLSHSNSGNSIKVKCERSRATYQVGQNLKIFINADDIALSTNKLEGITIQNQFEGIITDVIEKDNITLCMVDVGFNLIVEITRESLKRMNIDKGSTVCCLFKSVAIDVAG